MQLQTPNTNRIFLPVVPQYKRRHWGQIIIGFASFFFFLHFPKAKYFIKIKPVLQVCEFRFYLHCTSLKKKSESEEADLWAESKVVEQNIQHYYLQFGQRKREIVFFYIPYRFLEIIYKSKKSIWKVVSALFFCFLWFQIQHRAINCFWLYKKGFDRKELLDLSTHFLKSHLSFLFFLTVFNTQCCLVL